MKEDREGGEMRIEEKDGGREGWRRRHRGERCKLIWDAIVSESEKREEGTSWRRVSVIYLQVKE